MFIRFLISVFLIFLSLNAVGQNRDIPFHSKTHAENVDYHSFGSMLVLRHDVGRFYKLPKNPVLMPSRSGWDKKDVSDPFVLVTADSIYLFYDGSSGGRYSIGYAIRDPEGWFWMKRGRILETSNGAWDSYHQIDPNIIQLGEQWRLYYSGNSSDSEFGYQIGVATKTKNREWNYSRETPLMILDSTDWDFAGNIYANVHYFPEMDIFKLWYSGFQGPLSAIGMAESKDGYQWRKIGDGPVFNVFPGVIAPAVVYNGEEYIMYFAQLNVGSSFHTKICRAESQDGIHWKNMEDVLNPTEKWEGSKLMRPNLSFFEQRVHLYYSAQKGSNWHIGEATADAIFEKRGIWRSQVITEKAGRIQIKFEQPEGTSIQAFIAELNSGKKIPLSIFDYAAQTLAPAGVSSQGDSSGFQMHQIRKGVYSTTLSDIVVEGDWQIELELETTVENRSPVIYEISLN